MLLAYKLALASPRIRARGVEASEFAVDADRHGVHAVPAIVVDVKDTKRQLWAWAAGAVLVLGALVYLLGPILSPFLFGAILQRSGYPAAWPTGTRARNRVPGASSPTLRLIPRGRIRAARARLPRT